MADLESSPASGSPPTESPRDPEKDVASQPAADTGSSTGPKDRHLVEFDGDDDEANPLNWSKARKWTLVSLIATLTLVA